ncbi:MAG: hypothetical protein KGZ71_00010 [Desulfobulbaceae bacterium]|nr:hypothetical protein [Desulfobulbaceae bacterium]
MNKYMFFIFFIIFVLFGCKETELNDVISTPNFSILNNDCQLVGDLHNNAVNYYIENHYDFPNKTYVGIDSTLYLTQAGFNNIKSSLTNFMLTEGYSIIEINSAFALIDSFNVALNLKVTINNNVYYRGLFEDLPSFADNLIDYLSEIGIDSTTIDLISLPINLAGEFESSDNVMSIINSITVPSGASAETINNICLFKSVANSSHDLWYDEERVEEPITSIRKWWQKNAPKDKGSWVIICDAVGALYLSSYGPFWSIVASTYSSVYANETFAD